VGGGDELAEADAEEADRSVAVPEFVEKVFDNGDEEVVGGGVVNGGLPGEGVEIIVPYFDGNGACDFVFFAEFETNALGEAYEFGEEKFAVGGIGVEGVFAADGFLFVFVLYGRIVYAVGFAPECGAGFAESLFELFLGYFAELLHGADAECVEGGAGGLANHGNFFDEQGCEKGFFFSGGYFELSVGFGFVGGYLADEFVGRESVGDGQSGFFDDGLFELADVFADAEEFVHAGEVNIKFVNGGFFIEGCFVGDDLCNEAGVVAVAGAVAGEDDGVGAKFECGFDGHGGVDAVFAGFVTAGGYYAAVGVSAHDEGLSFEGGVFDTFNGDEEGVEVEVGDMTGGCVDVLMVDG
jgi:hypothetical protein